MSQADDEFTLGFEQVTYGVNRRDLEAIGERAVRLALDSGEYGHHGTRTFDFVAAWLADKEFARLEDDRAVAKDANRIAENSNRIAAMEANAAALSARYAIYTALIALITLIATNRTEILRLIGLSP